MDVSYNKFFKMLIDRKMKKKDICEQAGIATSTMAKMAKDENVSLDVLARICRALDCTMDDILDVLPAENEK
ncbi:helix-turn-helix domain-containing protein [Simiaoa sunii]|jgi:putative transcriptional regulator|uniref:Helix-turn-helix transcriptional regulator n=1 Tax=Simiaoa sunii TaxID=2763672 RepID=A0A7G9FXU8_9FIRM|nr:helix-turn-helix transcriptional regulator [Simiaoa sunii]QNM03380.1 helix-turn-helix transcriptional regulator [Simiaoa sunii]RHP99064.1 XRE family transcriptional regulator [Firmicutes bacterium AM59-13]